MSSITEKKTTTVHASDNIDLLWIKIHFTHGYGEKTDIAYLCRYPIYFPVTLKVFAKEFERRQGQPRVLLMKTHVLPAPALWSMTIKWGEVSHNMWARARVSVSYKTGAKVLARVLRCMIDENWRSVLMTSNKLLFKPLSYHQARESPGPANPWGPRRHVVTCVEEIQWNNFYFIFLYLFTPSSHPPSAAFPKTAFTKGIKIITRKHVDRRVFTTAAAV